jgi:hypothetical protein
VPSQQHNQQPLPLVLDAIQSAGTSDLDPTREANKASTNVISITAQPATQATIISNKTVSSDEAAAAAEATDKVKFIIGNNALTGEQMSGASTPVGVSTAMKSNSSNSKNNNNNNVSDESSESSSPPELNHSLNQDGISELLIRSHSVNESATASKLDNEYARYLRT